MSYRMQHWGTSQALEEYDQSRRSAHSERWVGKAIEYCKRTGKMPKNASAEMLSQIASRMIAAPASQPKAARRKRRKTRHRRTGADHRTTTVPRASHPKALPLKGVLPEASLPKQSLPEAPLTDRVTVWSSQNGSFPPSDLKYYLSRFRWDVLVNLPHPKPLRPEDWLEQFHAAIDTTDLFPCQRRHTNEPPSWLAFCYTDADGVQHLTILLALPPGALTPSHEIVSGVLTGAVRTLFGDHAKPEIQVATSTALGTLEQRLRMTPFECVTRFLRQHNRKGGAPNSR